MTTTANSKPFDQAKAIADYTELQRQADGSSARDEVKLSIRNLEYQAESRGLQFVRQADGSSALEPMSEQEQGLRWFVLTGWARDAAYELVTEAMPYVTVEGTRPYQYHFESDRWYFNVDVRHHDPEQGAAMVLVRVNHSYETGFLEARRVTVVEAE